MDAARFGVRLRGYDCAEVDELLDRLVVLTHPSPVPPSSPGDDPVSMPASAIADRPFKSVLRGWDPKEVHEYLVTLEARVAAPSNTELDARRRADALVTSARIEADAILGAARREADDIGRQRDAMDDWFGPQEGAGPAAADRWGALGEHVARLMAQAESEASTIVAEADARSAAAQAEADALLESASSGARAHVAAVLADAESQLEVARAELASLRDKLAEVHQQLGRSLDVVGDDLVLQPANQFIDVGALADAAEPVAPVLPPLPVREPELVEASVAAPQAADWPYAAPSAGEPVPVVPQAEPTAPEAPAGDAPLTAPQVTSTWP